MIGRRNLYLRLRKMSHTIYVTQIILRPLSALLGLQFMLPMEKSVTFTGACANEIIPNGSWWYWRDKHMIVTWWYWQDNHMIVTWWYWQDNHMIVTHSNMTSFFRFVNKRASYPFGIISLAHAPVNVTDFSIGSINCNPNNADRGRSIIRVT
jgi:uncharacterized protein YneR